MTFTKVEKRSVFHLSKIRKSDKKLKKYGSKESIAMSYSTQKTNHNKVYSEKAVVFERGFNQCLIKE